MPDDFDRTNDREEALLGFHLQAARAKAGKREIQPTGNCHWCGDDTARPDALFCCGDCSIDWHKHKQLSALTR